MGLLRRKDRDGTPHRLPGYAALAPGDMKDARRRRPDVDLSAYAAARGLDFLGGQNAAGYFAALPLDDQLQFNVMRGTLAGRRDGCLFHWVRAWPVDNHGDAVGTFFGKVWAPPLGKGWWKPDRTDIPYVGWLLNPPDRGGPEYDQAIGVPCTAAATLVPESSLLPDFSIDNRARPMFVGGHREKLKDRGLSGYSLVSAVEPDPAVVDRLLGPGAPLRDVIAAGGRHALWEIAVRRGTLVVVRNGYAKEDVELEALVKAVCDAGDALRDACLPAAGPRPFAEPLPAVDWPPQGVSLSGRFPPSPWLEAFHGLAARLGMTLEEPAAYHRAFPSLAVPGRCIAVMRGALPGTSVEGRLAFHTERDHTRFNDGRTALLLPAAPDAEETPPWGVRLTDPRIAYAVRDGIFAAWVLRSPGAIGDLGDVAGLLTTAFGFGVERGLAASG